MSKRIATVLVAVACALIVALPVFAGGDKESQGSGAALPAGPLLPWNGEEVVWDGCGSDLGMKNDPNMLVYQEYMKTTGNARIEWQTFPWNDYDQKLLLYLQSGDMPDIMWVRDSVGKIATFGVTGIFLDWDQYKDRMPTMQKWVAQFPHVNNILTDKGERFAINDVTNAEYIGEGWFYNPGLLQKAGISRAPETIEDLIAAMIAVKRAVPAADGYLSYWGMSYIISALANSMNVQTGIGYDARIGKWIHGPTQDPNYKKLIEYLNQMFKAGVFNPDAIAEGVSSEKVDELLAAGNYAFTYRYYGSEKVYFDPDKGQESPFAGMAPPKFNGERWYRITVPHDSVPYWGYMAPKNVHDPELLASYVDNIMTPETYLLFEWGIEGVTYVKNADGSLSWKPGTTAQQRADLGVYNFWDPRYIHYSDYQMAWFSKNLGRDNPIGRAAAIADVKRLESGEMKPWWGWPRPQMSAEQNDEISKIMTPVNTFVDENRLKFITGDRPLSEWNDFIAQAKRLADIDKVIAYYNAGKQFPMGARKYPNLFE
jgi:putative aldouronate transport system substrate-binding protein